MDETNKTIFLDRGGRFFSGLKTTWTGTDLQHIYEMYNMIHGTDKKDTGCPSCRRETINEVRDYYVKLINNKI